MSSHIFNIQNTFAIASAIQGVASAASGESAVQRSNATREQQSRIAAGKERITQAEESAATVDLSQNESSQRSLYTPLPRKRKGRDDEEPDENEHEEDNADDVRHIDITA